MKPTVTWLLAWACCVAFNAYGQAAAMRSALIVGVSSYASPDIPVLAGVSADIVSARRIAEAMGITPAHTTVLLDAQATKAGILGALERLAADAAEGSRVFVYFSGHGTRWFETQHQGCMEGLLAFDRQTITNEEIASRTRRMSAVADKVVVLFDACHSGGVSPQRASTRAIASGALTAKFYLKSGADAQACSQPSNLKTRSLLVESTRLGALSENFVQITSSRADEVSFDDPDLGGIATQSVRDCLLGQGVDLDGSGAISMREVESCAQRLVEQKLKPFADLRPHHITVSGNRNIVPVAAVRPAPLVVPAPQPIVVTAPVAPTVAPEANPDSMKLAAAVPAAPTTLLAQPVTAVAPSAPASSAQVPVQAMPPVPTTVAPALASLATLQEIEAQRNPRRKLEVTLSSASLRIGHDALALTLRSSHDGHVYLVLLGSDRKSFYLLFPNGLDQDNAIRANRTLTLPRPDWRLLAQGPAGTDHLLVLVADTPRDLAALRAAAPDAAAPFTFTLNDQPGRSALVDYFTGSGVSGRSESFGARLLSLQERP